MSRQKIFETCHRRITHGKFSVSTKSSPPSFATASTVGRLPRLWGERARSALLRAQQNLNRCFFPSIRKPTQLYLCVSEPGARSLQTVQLKYWLATIRDPKKHRVGGTRHLGTLAAWHGGADELQLPATWSECFQRSIMPTWRRWGSADLQWW